MCRACRAIFAANMVVAKYVHESSNACMCLCDYRKHLILLSIFGEVILVGFNGKMWQFLCSWYEMKSTDGNVSPADLSVQRGFRQGMVSSPTHFVLIVNSLSIQLQVSGLGPFILCWRISTSE